MCRAVGYGESYAWSLPTYVKEYNTRKSLEGTKITTHGS